MEVRLYLSYLADRDILGQDGIHCPPEGLHVQARRRVQVHHLAHGVNPGVGATSGHHAAFLLRYPANRSLQSILHGALPILMLEPVIGSTVVLQGQPQPAHRHPPGA